MYESSQGYNFIYFVIIIKQRFSFPLRNNHRKSLLFIEIKN